jgi:outer membrane protein assembly factor BamB
MDNVPPEVAVDHDTNQVSRRDPSGRLLWVVKLKGDLGCVRLPDLTWDMQRVFLSGDQGVTALDFGTGKVLWHSNGPNNGLLLSDGLLLATGPVLEDDDRVGKCWLLARSARDGAEVFKVRLPLQEHYPSAVREVAGLFAVQANDLSGKVNACLVDQKGVLRHRFNSCLIEGTCRGDDRVFLTSKEVVRLTPDGKVRWAIPFNPPLPVAGGGLVERLGDDLIAFRYGPLWDSGVDVIRFRLSTGEVMWKAFCAPLGVSHSKYSHRGGVATEKDIVRVTSCGDAGTFVELLDLETGRQLKRTVRKR